MLRKRPQGPSTRMSHTCWAAGAAVCGPGRKGSWGICSVCLYGVPLEISCFLRKPQERRFQSMLVLCFFCCSAYLEALPTVCTEQYLCGHKPTPGPWPWVQTETHPLWVGPPCPQTSHLVRTRFGYRYPGSWYKSLNRC